MSELRIRELANEEVVIVFPEFKDTRRTYISDLAKNATDRYMHFNDSAVIESDSKVREKLSAYLKDIRESSGLK